MEKDKITYRKEYQKHKYEICEMEGYKFTDYLNDIITLVKTYY